MAEPRRRLAPMAAWNAGGWLATALYGFVVTRLIIQHTGDASYGVWATIGAVRGFIMFLDGGLALCVNRDAARMTTDAEEATARIRATRRIYAGLALLSVVALAVGSGFPSLLLSLEGADASVAGAVMVLVGVETGAALLASPLAAVLRGRERFDALSTILWLHALLGIGLLTYLAPRHGLEGAAWATASARAALLVGTWLWMRARRLIPSAGLLAKGTMRKVIAFSSPLWMVAAGTQLAVGTDVPVVGAFHGAGVAGHYALGATLPSVAAGLLFAMLGATFPRLVAASDSQRRHTTGLLLFMATFLAAAGFGFIALHEQALLTLWVGRAPPFAVSVAVVLCVCWAINMPTHVLASVAIAIDAHRVVGMVVLLEALANLVLSAYLAMTWSPMGPAVGTLITIGISNGIVLPVLLRPRLGLRWGQILRPVLFGGLGGLLTAVAVRGVTLITGESFALAAVVGGLLTVGVAGIVLDLTVAGTSRVAPWLRLTWRGGWRVRARQQREIADERARLERLRRDSPIVWSKSKAPLVTVRIATYNRGRLVADRAIASALAQTHENLEILVVGDHCDEATAQAVLSVSDSRVRFVNLPERGRYPAEAELRWMVAGSTPMKHAVQIARGEWIAALDDDDEFLPEHVEILLDACRSEGHEFVYGVSEFEQADGSWGRCGSWPLRQGQIIHAAAMWWSQIAICHDIESWRLNEPSDWNAWHRMQSAGVRMGFVDQVVTRHYEERREIDERPPFFVG
jgi:O-antigen/teichoic acid export membrane protein